MYVYAYVCIHIYTCFHALGSSWGAGGTTYLYTYIYIYIHPRDESFATYGGLCHGLQYRGEAERVKVSFCMASVAE